MRSFQQIVAVLFAFLMCAVAESASASSSVAYDATVYITSTVYRVNTVTMSGSPSGSVANQTSTIPAVYPTGASPSYHAGNGTSVAPTATSASPSPSQFTGAASALNANAYLAAFAAGVGYLVL